MGRVSSMVTPTELEVLEVLWSRGELSTREISQAIYGTNGTVQHATVNSLLSQLEGKGLVERDRSGFAHVFRAKVDKATLVGRQLQEIADTYFGGSLIPAMLTMVEKLALKPKDRKAIQKIIDQIED